MDFLFEGAGGNKTAEHTNEIERRFVMKKTSVFILLLFSLGSMIQIVSERQLKYWYLSD